MTQQTVILTKEKELLVFIL